MNTRNPHHESWRNRLAGLAAFVGVRAWMSSLDYIAHFADPTTDPASPHFEGPVIAVFWHESLMVPFYLYGHTHTAILTSLHRDGDWISSSAAFLGYQTVRGSSRRGGDRALLKMARTLRGHNFGIACDGPRGPRRQMAPGPVYLSSRLQMPIVPYGIAFRQARRLSTWDRFSIACPYSRVHLVFGPRLQVPPDLNREGLEHYRQRAQQALDDATGKAEAWAAGEAGPLGHQHLRRRAMPADAQRRLRQKLAAHSKNLSSRQVRRAA